MVWSWVGSVRSQSSFRVEFDGWGIEATNKDIGQYAHTRDSILFLQGFPYF